MRDGHSYAEFRAPPELAPLVRELWVQTVTRPLAHSTVPNGSVELTCAVGASPRITGPHTRTITQTLPPGTTVAGIRLNPGAAAAVLGMPPAELTDMTVDAGLVFGRSGTVAPDTADDALALLRRLVSRHAGDAEPLVASAVRRHELWRVGATSAGLGISDSQFRRRCLAASGLPPKTLFRLLRFQVFLAMAQREILLGRDPIASGLASLATAAGYADQPHLTRECGRLTGLTPGTFLRQTTQSCGPGHDHAVSVARTLSMPDLRSMPGLINTGSPPPA
jgi:AraC-like DNA-binding protein